MNLTAIKNLIFDLDGTLIDSSQGIIKATNYALECAGEKARPDAEIVAYIGFPLKNMFRDFSDKPFDEFWAPFKQKAREIMVDSAVALEHADQVIHRLHNNGYVLSIASTKITPHIEGIVDKLGWAGLFRGFVGADSVTEVKPAPEPFLRAVELMQASIENSMVIGDTINDILAARAAKIKSVAVKSPFGNNHELQKSNPDIYIEKLSDLLDILK